MRELALDHAKKLSKYPETWQQVHEALRLQDLCHVEMNDDPKSKSTRSDATDDHRRTTMKETYAVFCTPTSPCSFVQIPSRASISLRAAPSTVTIIGSIDRPWTSIHDALAHTRTLRRDGNILHPKIVLRQGLHSLDAKPLELIEQDSDLSIVGYPGEDVWISGGLALDNVDFQASGGDGIYVANLTKLLEQHALPTILSLFTTTRRYIRARHPNSDPEIDQWGYSSPHRLDYSIAGGLVLDWHRPPITTPPEFTFVDFQEGALPPGVPGKNDSAQREYNWYASGKGGACSDIWGDEANSYWCSNASSGGWAEVDRECAVTGQMQLPIGMTYNTSSSSELERFRNASLNGGILHAWHSQSWAMHMFEITSHTPSGEMTFAKGGGRQGGRNWCRCDQCTYAAGWCGQHQTPAWNDTRLISGTWMVENVLDELDQPGEYFFDRQRKLLYVKPNSTIDLVDFRIGMMEELFDFRHVGNVTIENLGFRDTAPTYMADWSAPSGGDWSLQRGGAIFLENVSNVTIRNCHFRRLDGNAIFLSRKTRNVTIDGNRFEWLGENAIATWGDTNDYDATAGEFPMYTLIQHNIMRELGIYQKQSSAVGLAKTALTTIRNNIMFNTPRAAINFNDMVGGGDVIEGNLIFNTCRESGDHGPINSWDRQPFLTTLRDGVTKSFDPIPRVIQNNYIIANYGASQGVDNDDGSSWFHIRHNLFYSADGFKMDYGGHDSVFADNLVMAYPYDGSQCFNMGGFLEGHEDALQRNRCLVGLGNKMGSGCGDPSCAEPTPESEASQQLIGRLWGGCEDSPPTLSSNEYYTPDGEAKIQCGNEDTYSLEELQVKFGLEGGSTNARLPDEDTMLSWAEAMINFNELAAQSMA
jgi:hypothetical protein